MKYSAVAIIFTVVSAGALAAPQLKIDRITEIRDCGNNVTDKISIANNRK